MIADLPDELILEIGFFVTKRSLCRFLQCSKRFWNLREKAHLTVLSFDELLYQEAQANNYEFIEELLKKYGKNAANHGMIQAVKEGNFSLTDYFFNKGADEIVPALKRSASKGNLEHVKFFLEKMKREEFSYGCGQAAFDAAWEGHKHIVELLFTQDPDPWTREMALFGASGGGHKNLIELAIDKGAENWDGAMRSAAEGGHKQWVDFFINKGAANWNDSLRFAAYGGQKEMVEYLMEKGADDTIGAMLRAVRAGKIELVKYFIDIGTPPCRKMIQNISDTATQTIENALEVAEILVEHGYGTWEDFLNKVWTGYDYIWAPNSRCHEKILQTVLDKGGIDLNTALGFAVRKKLHSFIDVLIQRGANDMNHGLCSAVRINDDNLIDFFIKRGANDWNSAMCAAAQIVNLSLVQTFVEKGANDWNRGLAAGVGYNSLHEYFIEKGANDWNGAMCAAAKLNFMEDVEFFIEKGANDWNAGLEQSALSMPTYDTFLTRLLLKRGAVFKPDGGLRWAIITEDRALIRKYINQGADWKTHLLLASQVDDENMGNNLVSFVIKEGQKHEQQNRTNANRTHSSSKKQVVDKRL